MSKQLNPVSRVDLKRTLFVKFDLQMKPKEKKGQAPSKMATKNIPNELIMIRAKN